MHTNLDKLCALRASVVKKFLTNKEFSLCPPCLCGKKVFNKQRVFSVPSVPLW